MGLKHTIKRGNNRRGNRKAILFTLISLLLAALFIVIFSTQVQTPYDAKTPLIDMKINNMKIYNNNLETYTQTVLGIAAYDSLMAMSTYLNSSGRALQNDEEVECIFADFIEDGRLRYVNDSLVKDPTTGEEKDIQFKINNDILDNIAGADELFEINSSAPEINMTYAIYQNFTAENTAKLQNVKFSANIHTNAPPSLVKVQVYLARCGYPQYLLDEAYAAVQPGLSTTEYTVQFYRDQTISEGQMYYIMFSGDEYFNLSLNAGDPPTSHIADSSAKYIWINDSYLNPTLANYTGLDSWLGTFINISHNELGIDTNYTVTETTLEQFYPWTLTVSANFLFTSNDSTSSYRNNVTLSRDFDIDGLPDPLYIYNQYGINRIYRAPSGIDKGFNISVFTNFTEQKLYWEDDLAPSYLDRLKNSTNSTTDFGIESVINFTMLDDMSVIFSKVYNKSFIDYLYLNGSNISCDDLYTMNITPMVGTPEYTFWNHNQWNQSKFDREHLILANISTTYWIQSPCSS
ncbi:MAG: hypothetical protein V1743_08355 [Nanoarchaeota archaeon]